MQVLKGFKERWGENPERLLFLAICLLFLGPVFASRFFATQDGCSHAYNAQVISELLFGKGLSPAADLFELNSRPVPNWLSHVLLLILQSFMKAEYALKIVHALYVIGIAYGFRFLMLTLNPGKKWAAYFVFPLVYNFFLFMGFYNFLFSLVLLFFTLGLWIRSKEDGWVLKAQVGFTLLFILTWFSHLAGFGLLVISIGCYELIAAISTSGVRKGIKPMVAHLWKSFLKISVPLLLPVVCTVLYYSQRHVAEVKFRTADQLLAELKCFGTLTTYSNDIPSHIDFFTVLWFIVPVVALLFFFRKAGAKYQSEFRPPSFILAVTLVAILFAMCFLLPDEDGSGTMISPRIIFLIYLFIPFVLAATRTPRMIGMLLAAWVVYDAWALNGERAESIQQNNILLTAIQQVGEKIEPGSTVQSFSFTNNWIMGSLPYLAICDKNCAAMNNYEAATDYFPVRWKEGASTAYTICGTCPEDYNYTVGWMCYKGFEGNAPDYILTVGDYVPVADTAAVHSFIRSVESCYTKVAEERTVILYHRKN